MTRAQAEARIKKAAPWATLVYATKCAAGGFQAEAYGDDVVVACGGPTFSAAAARLESVLRGTS